MPTSCATALAPSEDDVSALPVGLVTVLVETSVRARSLDDFSALCAPRPRLGVCDAVLQAGTCLAVSSVEDGVRGFSVWFLTPLGADMFSLAASMGLRACICGGPAFDSATDLPTVAVRAIPTVAFANG